MNTQVRNWSVAGAMSLVVSVFSVSSVSADDFSGTDAVLTGLAIGTAAAVMMGDQGHRHEGGYREVREFYSEPVRYYNSVQISQPVRYYERPVRYYQEPVREVTVVREYTPGYRAYEYGHGRHEHGHRHEPVRYYEGGRQERVQYYYPQHQRSVYVERY